VLDVQITNIDPDVQMELELFGEDQASIDKANNYSYGGELNYDYLLDSGTYYLRLNDLSNNDSGEEVYNLTVSLDTNDANEINNSFQEATSLTLGETIQGTIRSVGDKDFYIFTLSEETEIEVQITGVDPGIQMEIELFGENQASIDKKQNYSSGGDLTFTSENLRSGTYYLRLNDIVNDDSGEEVYNLIVSKK
jgi:hypothetical protein